MRQTNGRTDGRTDAPLAIARSITLLDARYKFDDNITHRKLCLEKVPTFKLFVRCQF